MSLIILNLRLNAELSMVQSVFTISLASLIADLKSTIVDFMLSWNGSL